MNIRPLYDRLVVKRIVKEPVSAGGIILALDEPVKDPIGTVLAIGSDVDLAVGDKIVFGKSAGMEVKVDGQDVLVMRESDVIAVVS